MSSLCDKAADSHAYFLSFGDGAASCPPVGILNQNWLAEPEPFRIAHQHLEPLQGALVERQREPDGNENIGHGNEEKNVLVRWNRSVMSLVS